jgi:hypothetical protein
MRRQGVFDQHLPSSREASRAVRAFSSRSQKLKGIRLELQCVDLSILASHCQMKLLSISRMGTAEQRRGQKFAQDLSTIEAILLSFLLDPSRQPLAKINRFASGNYIFNSASDGQCRGSLRFTRTHRSSKKQPFVHRMSSKRVVWTQRRLGSSACQYHI